ncbi:MAG: glycerate kinase [Armatimonadetes bacterium]|nr:glycerate kinase [Armatimonadota bacterium]NIM23029.1 glycerate kinase [Armatimonadota bacterium]NIM66897.1 glycerate kinase [Armatimonadota bacterium]NIM75431.1 glycerate kinase [Armatimonadota bacterium]NIN05088.1 glycerate kinase [Armatimonadota bacterium]
MNILIAPDSFKGSLSAAEAAEAIRQGIRVVMPESETVSLPLADGGEGTVEALVTATHGRFITTKVTGPLGDPVEARWGVLGDDITAVIEMAAASGLPLVPPEKRNPLITTTYGTGELICAALEAGCTKLIIGIGGSATNDGGAGMAQALGAELLDAAGKPMGRGGAALANLDRIHIAGMEERLERLEVKVASDVGNPLCGPEGAAAIYGPQKGATPEMVKELDSALAHYAEIIARDLKVDVKDLPGAGAAGGLGAGLIAFLKGKIQSGAALVLDTISFEEYLAAADLVITGEGKIDSQLEFGKTLAGVGALARRYHTPVVAIAGAVDVDPERLTEMGISVAIPCVNSPMEETESVERAAELVQEATERIMRLLFLGRELAGSGR